MSALRKAIQTIGRPELARRLGVTNMAISQWLKRGLPIERAIQIEAATDGLVSRADLRPDIFGPESGVAPPRDSGL